MLIKNSDNENISVYNTSSKVYASFDKALINF